MSSTLRPTAESSARTRPAAAGSAAAGSTRARRGSRVALRRGAAGVLVLVLILEIASRSSLIASGFLPPFSEVLMRALALWGDAVFRTDVLATLTAYVLGMTIAIVVAVPLGIAFGLSQPVYRSARAIVELIRPIPPVALVPLVILVLGSSLEMKLVIVVFAAVWPIMFNTLYGVHDVDPYAKEMARSFGVSRFGVIRRIVIPASTPFIATGVRIASSIALIVVITVELIAGGAQGLGAFISRTRAYGDADSYLTVLAATFIAGVLGLVINLILGWIERRFFAWDATTRGAQ
ncbi:ABC transporter permease [Leucobacter triazinivorans]|uniref:ABC transporter permease n=1 Tax=Leucobacter triazinivorans TaxID=1784719 RepID=A0A4P6KFT3_9MICO|nr:ABC transporter permease [Leucobacter triazinivorans]